MQDNEIRRLFDNIIMLIESDSYVLRESDQNMMTMKLNELKTYILNTYAERLNQD